MMEAQIVNRVHSYSSGTPGRSLNAVGRRHFVIDEPEYNGGPGDEIGRADAFLAGISSCGVLLLERFAAQAGVPLHRADATIEGLRRASNPSIFERVTLRFTLLGLNQGQAEQLVERYKGR